MANPSNTPDVPTLDVIAPVLFALRGDIKYTQALNVNVSNFVSVKLSGNNNYDIWMTQMFSLIESQDLLHIVDDKYLFPEDKGVHMIEQYDKLVKGWIFGSVGENVLKKIKRLDSAKTVWGKLDSIFDLPISFSDDDSPIAPDVPTPDVIAPIVSSIREDLKYIQASNVNVSNFVSVKLSGPSNYLIWKAQMICLLESQELIHILGDRYHFPMDMWKYDRLVKGWIFGSMNEKVVKNFAHINLAQEVWRQLELFFSPPVPEGDSWKYTGASYVNVSSYVSVKLSGHNNFDIWKGQMCNLIESQELHHVIYETYPPPENMSVNTIHYNGKLVKDWILDTMNENLRREFEHFIFARELWRELLLAFKRQTISRKGYIPTATEDFKYMLASSVNASCFVSVKLSGHSNYHIWKAQMRCLLESQMLLYFIDDEEHFPDDKGVHMLLHYNDLVRGWIFGSMNEKMLKDFQYYDLVQDIWKKLESLFSPRVMDDADSLGFMFGSESVYNGPETQSALQQLPQQIDSIIRKRLYEAAIEGCWWKAKSILKVHKNAATEAITGNGNTILHISVEMGQNYFVGKLLEFLKDGKDIETRNYNGRTALHIAAMVGNIHAAQLLIQKRKELLMILDRRDRPPLYGGYCNNKYNMITHLFKSYASFEYSSIYHGFDSRNASYAIEAAIFKKQYDLARTWFEKYSEVVKEDKYMILKAISITFPTDLGFTESFIYPSFHNVLKTTVVRGFLLCQYNILDKCVDDIVRVVKTCNNTCYSWLGKISMILLVPIATLYPIYQLICFLILVLRLPFSVMYFLLWKVLALTVHPIKNIERKKKMYQEAKNILSLICNQMGVYRHNISCTYNDLFLEAARQGTYEVVDEMLFMSPDAINIKDEDGHNIIQIAIINRSEKVYNLIRHIIERTEHYRTMKDSLNNNLAHLAGRLAPSSVLDRTTGAALQLQRELLWREEVEKLMLPLELWDENIYKETPANMFTREHQELMKQGENWMKTTAESCSITAALIVTVVFAAAITVPGGSNQESGIPVFKREIAFTIFAISNAFSLFTAATALLLFLSILTARFSEIDFLVSLPRRLIFGLFMLFLSTTAMIVAFGAILFLVFCDQRPWMLAPICVFSCLPISVIVTIKLPLLADLIQSTYFPIFGKQSYLESCKTNRKNTIFVD